MAQALSTRWATGGWGWKMSGRNIWLEDTPLSWGTHPLLSPMRSKYRAGTATAGDQSLRLLPVTQEKMVSYRSNKPSWFSLSSHYCILFRVSYLHASHLSSAVSITHTNCFYFFLTVNFLCYLIQPCLQSTFGIVCGQMCQVKFFTFTFSPMVLTPCRRVVMTFPPPWNKKREKTLYPVGSR